ncbi:16S rRNA (guanine(527)-N(7))-methyltransferase RsmG [Nitrosomonas sp. ANs5]|uniref:16S rRNA (guanine(527)-N(7))-methyltransferase RsmG n=1 Tax=Nitrosomonas sp. ANs5 TaxID=3423941 RepID=UPI003D34815B
MDLEKRLLEGLKALPGMPADVESLGHRLLQYIELIAKWNTTHNLTAVRDPEAMIARHLLDSLTVLPHISGPNIVDAGSGAGLPGIPIALARPDWRVILVESNQKKAAFLMQAAVELNLTNVVVKSQRIEKLSVENKIDTVISRAFSSLNRFAQLAGGLCKDNVEHCRLVAMKGAFPDLELMQLSPEFKVEQIIALTVPGLRAKRHLIVLRCS